MIKQIVNKLNKALTKNRVINALGFVSFILTLLITSNIIVDREYMVIITFTIAVIGYFTTNE